jgi:hypothetical protein
MSRSDGTLLNNLPFFRVLNPLLMRSRTESTIFIPCKVDVTHTLEYVEQLNASREDKVSIFNVILTAVVRTFTLRPQLNRFVIGHDIYQRNKLQFSFIAKKELSEHGAETNVKLTCSPYETVCTIIDKLKEELGVARSEEGNESEKQVNGLAKYPGFLLRFAIKAFRWLDRHNLAPASMIESDPLYTSCYLTNVGSIHMPSPFHHLFEWGTASLFIGFGEYYKTPVVDENGEIVARDIMDIVVVYDDRISEGIYGARAIKLMTSFIESPEQLEQPPEIPQEILDELMLKPIKEKTDESPAESKEKKPEKSKLKPEKSGDKKSKSKNKNAEP